MLIKTCQAANLAVLVEKVKAQYGLKAVLLSVRRIESAHGAAYIEGTVAMEKLAASDNSFNDAEQAIPPVYAEPCAQKSKKMDENGRVIALVGPVGAGKTTTAAKIAGRLALRCAGPVGVISTDTERPGGPALLAAYAQELQLSMTSVSSASDLRNRLSRWNCRGPLVIDTRGYSPRDSLSIERLGTLLSSTEATMERYLVMSATEHPSVARECLDAFAVLDLNGAILTRVDQAAGIGHCLREVRKRGVHMPFVGTGERVPEDLMDATAQSVMALESPTGSL